MKSCCLFLLLGLLLFSNCRKKQEPESDCIRSMITDFASNSCEHGAKVDHYVFQGRTVYVFILGFCGADLPANVVDGNCNYVGTLGGFRGNTKINGEEFSHAEFIATVWSR